MAKLSVPKAQLWARALRSALPPWGLLHDVGTTGGWRATQWGPREWAGQRSACHVSGTKLKRVYGSPAHAGVGGHDSSHVCQGTNHRSPRSRGLLVASWADSRGQWRCGRGGSTGNGAKKFFPKSGEGLSYQLSAHRGGMRVTSASKIVLAEFAMSLSGHPSQHVVKGAFIERFMRP